MVQHVITKTVRNKRVVCLVVLEGHPVVVQLLGAKHQHILVTIFVILDHRKRRESLAKTHAIGENATVVFFQFVDDGKGCIFLEIVKLFPNGTFLETRRRIRQNIFADVVQEFMENIVERYKVNEVRRIFLIDGSDAIHDRLGHFFKLRFIKPTFVELVDVIVRKRGRNPHAKIGNVVAFFYTKAHRRKLVERRIKRVVIGLLYMHKRLIVQVGYVRPEFYLLTNPLGALHRNCFLVQLVAQLQFKFTTEQCVLAGRLFRIKRLFPQVVRNIKFATFLGRLLFHERLGRKNKPQGINLPKFILQGLERIKRKTGRSNRKF